MTRLDANKFGEFLTFLMSFRADPVFSWEIKEDDLNCYGHGLLVHVLDPMYVHGMLELIGGITAVTFFIYQVQSSADSALDIIIY